MSLGKKIAGLLKQRDMKQYQLAEKVGVPASCVSDWVRGKTHPRHIKLKKVARALGVEVAELVA